MIRASFWNRATAKSGLETDLSRIDDLLHEERLELVSKLVHFFRPTTGFHMVTESAAPAGAGLGRIFCTGYCMRRRAKSAGWQSLRPEEIRNNRSER